jgi:hypothetical protein
VASDIVCPMDTKVNPKNRRQINISVFFIQTFFPFHY